ncbi:hypothetical protein LCGC14_1483220 [marine sediment metagenome]|uniref:Uncharacterized protein n=1 Tax=marine sediment metagenome TaxID=412755 RepID=A0A0F9LPD8_9ZZZZ
MTNINIIGDKNGIILWNLMASTDDELEREYFTRLNGAASKFGSIWFTDIITQRKSKNNQTIWNMKWDGTQWEISRFYVPKRAKEVTARIRGAQLEEELIELDTDDVLLIKS